MKRVLTYLPEISGEEMNYIVTVTQNLSDDDLKTFAQIYRARRRDPQTVLVFAIVGLCIIPGLQRFYVDQVAMGILYLFTLGLCFVGSIIDIVNYKSLTQEYNNKIVNEALAVLRFPSN